MYISNQLLRSFLLVLFFVHRSINAAQAENPSDTKTIWTAQSPFEHKVFIENKGQCNGKSNLFEEIKYSAAVGNIQIYFSPAGLTYRYDEYVTIGEEAEAGLQKIPSATAFETENRPVTKLVPHFVNMIWEGANPGVLLEAEEKAHEYFTYPDLSDPTNKTCIKANAFKKIIYRNVYPNIDLEYTFPEGKSGVKYAFTLHPGANSSQIKMRYYSQEAVPAKDADGNIVLSCSFGDITDHAPLTKYADNSVIPSSFTLNNNIVSFNLDNYDISETIKIDPWTTVPTFTGMNRAYDVEYDLNGNVYIWGKLSLAGNSAG
jgi:hypothetical protein